MKPDFILKSLALGIAAWSTLLVSSVYSQSLQTTVSFKSHNFPERYVRHRGFLGFIEPINNDLGRKDASFRTVLELANSRAFPLRGSQFTELGDHRRMETSITISNNGRIDGVTRIWTAKKLQGFTGAVAVVITDSAGNVLHVTAPKSYGVDCRRCPQPSDRTQQWDDAVPSNILGQVGGYAIIHITNPRDRWREWLSTTREAATEVRSIYKEFGK